VQKELRDHRERLGKRSAEVRDGLVGSIAVHPVNIHLLWVTRGDVRGTRRWGNFASSIAYTLEQLLDRQASSRGVSMPLMLERISCYVREYEWFAVVV
jgi:hypothetical protein